MPRWPFSFGGYLRQYRKFFASNRKSKSPFKLFYKPFGAHIGNHVTKSRGHWMVQVPLDEKIENSGDQIKRLLVV